MQTCFRPNSRTRSAIILVYSSGYPLTKINLVDPGVQFPTGLRALGQASQSHPRNRELISVSHRNCHPRVKSPLLARPFPEGFTPSLTLRCSLTYVSSPSLPFSISSNLWIPSTPIFLSIHIYCFQSYLPKHNIFTHLRHPLEILARLECDHGVPDHVFPVGSRYDTQNMTLWHYWPIDSLMKALEAPGGSTCVVQIVTSRSTILRVFPKVKLLIVRETEATRERHGETFHPSRPFIETAYHQAHGAQPALRRVLLLFVLHPYPLFSGLHPRTPSLTITEATSPQTCRQSTHSTMAESTILWAKGGNQEARFPHGAAYLEASPAPFSLPR